MFIQFRVKVAKSDEKKRLSDIGIEVPYNNDELEEIIVEVNPIHIVSIEPYEDGYITSLTNGSELFTTYHPFGTEMRISYN